MKMIFKMIGTATLIAFLPSILFYGASGGKDTGEFFVYFFVVFFFAFCYVVYSQYKNDVDTNKKIEPYVDNKTSDSNKSDIVETIKPTEPIKPDSVLNNDEYSIVNNTTEEPFNIYKEKEVTQVKTVYSASLSQPLSNKQKYKENKKLGIVTCPKCGSSSITTTNKKLSIKRAIVGTTISPLVGAVGAVTSKKMYNICMNCGHKWKP